MRFGSVCSGIEAASVAWVPLGFEAAFLSEIDKFPRAVLAHHYPEVPLHGDFTTIERGQYADIDVLVGGTPCQSFSVAGLRGGVGDARGNLALEYLRLAERLRPRWIVWENVPGVLSSTSHDAPDPCAPPDDMAEGSEWVGEDEYDADESHAFACFLAGLSAVGYGWAYRSLDAQYAGLAQRRERVFVVGYLGDWRRAAAVLFEPESLRWDHPPSRQTRKGVAPTISARPTGGGGLGTDFDLDGGLDQAPVPLAFGGNNTAGPIDIATACNAHGGPAGRLDFESETFVTHALRADGFDASEDGTGRGTPLVACQAYRTSGNCGAWATGETVDALTTGTDQTSHVLAFTQNSRSEVRAIGGDGAIVGALAADAGAQQQNYVAVAFSCKDHGADAGDLAPTLRAMGHAGSHPNAGGQVAALSGAGVRRLTPRECERLQGFPDDYTLIPYRGGMAADGPRYKALGNSMAVPCMAWIGARLLAEDAAA
jgi:DNA (cytosine-5)-methyltransferase 1